METQTACQPKIRFTKSNKINKHAVAKRLLEITRQLGPPIPTTFGNTGISVLEKTTTGIPVLIPVFCSISEKTLDGAMVKTSQLGSMVE